MAREKCGLLAVPRIVFVSRNVLASGTRYIEDRKNTTQQSEQTSAKELEKKNITVYVSGYTKTDTTGILPPPTVWSFSVAM
jgi:hypothetical protein